MFDLLLFFSSFQVLAGRTLLSQAVTFTFGFLSSLNKMKSDCYKENQRLTFMWKEGGEVE